jgi:uncharacterized protein
MMKVAPERLSMRYLIDGYNLMHALGMAPQSGGLSLERSRSRFMEWLAVELGTRTAQITLIFDSARSASSGAQHWREMRILFANARTADDLIEELIRAEPAPRHLTIVSNDTRLQSAATRGGCVAWNCGTFIDWVQIAARTPKTDRASPEEKPAEPSTAELDEWLNRFEL